MPKKQSIRRLSDNNHPHNILLLIAVNIRSKKSFNFIIHGALRQHNNFYMQVYLSGHNPRIVCWGIIREMGLSLNGMNPNFS